MSNIIRDFRKKSGLTQKQLANEIGVTRETICRIEKDNMTMSSTVQIKLEEYFNIPRGSLKSKKVNTYSQLQNILLGKKADNIMSTEIIDRFYELFSTDGMNDIQYDKYQTFLYRTITAYATLCGHKKSEICNNNQNINYDKMIAEDIKGFMVKANSKL